MGSATLGVGKWSLGSLMKCAVNNINSFSVLPCKW